MSNPAKPASCWRLGDTAEEEAPSYFSTSRGEVVEMGKTILKHRCVYEAQSETPRHCVHSFKNHMNDTATIVRQRRTT